MKTPGEAARAKSDELDEEAQRPPPIPVDREALGRAVHHESGYWPLTWEKLDEPDREIDRRIGERLYRMGETAAAARYVAIVEALQATDRAGEFSRAAATARAENAERERDGERAAHEITVAECNRLAGDLAAMRPVVEAAIAWHGAVTEEADSSIGKELVFAVNDYLAARDAHATAEEQDPGPHRHQGRPGICVDVKLPPPEPPVSEAPLRKPKGTHAGTRPALPALISCPPLLPSTLREFAAEFAPEAEQGDLGSIGWVNLYDHLAWLTSIVMQLGQPPPDVSALVASLPEADAFVRQVGGRSLIDYGDAIDALADAVGDLIRIARARGGR